MLMLLFLVTAVSYTGTAGPPSITNITMIGAGPRLSIQSDVGVTNQIQCAANLAQTNWTVLTNLAVAQSPYWFVDSAASPATQRFYRVVILNQTSNPVPSGMALIPAGSFEMGDTFNEGEPWELPVHTVYVSAFYMDKYEVSKGLWDEMKAWNGGNGYSYDNPGSGKAANHPVQSIDWYDMVKWCNARSEKEGRVPAYYTDAALTQVYKTGRAAPYVNWNAGYRLPAEAEWEKGSRGGARGHRFPWADNDTITHSQANYYSDSTYPFDISPTRGFNPAFDDGVMPFTSPVGSFAPNGYGLYDMAGNVWEWCWDWSDSYSSNSQTDPRGPATGSTRVGRGGNWNYYSVHCRTGYRYGNSPDYSATNIGFRCALPTSQ
jgi:sulfatase modifying factor 1